MPTFNLFPEAVRGAASGIRVVTGQAAGPVRFEMISSDLRSRPEVEFDWTIERSFDNQATWVSIGGGAHVKGGPTPASIKLPANALPVFGWYFDGVNCVLKFNVTPNMNFSYGLNVTL
jgi:hypothetical protein